MIRALLLKWAILAVAVWVTAAHVSGFTVDGGVGTWERAGHPIER